MVEVLACPPKKLLVAGAGLCSRLPNRLFVEDDAAPKFPNRLLVVGWGAVEPKKFVVGAGWGVEVPNRLLIGGAVAGLEPKFTAELAGGAGFWPNRNGVAAGFSCVDVDPNVKGDFGTCGWVVFCGAGEPKLKTGVEA